MEGLFFVFSFLGDSISRLFSTTVFVTIIFAANLVLSFGRIRWWDWVDRAFVTRVVDGR